MTSLLTSSHAFAIEKVRIAIGQEGYAWNVPACNGSGWRDDFPALRGDVLYRLRLLALDTGTIGRSYVLLELGVKLTIPPIWIQRGDPIWYVDLAIVTRKEDLYQVVDLDIDVFVPTDDRPYRMLDLDEFADAIKIGEFTLSEAMDGLRRWQRFLDTHLHRYGPIEGLQQESFGQRDVHAGWRDFPPEAITPMMELRQDAFRV